MDVMPQIFTRLAIEFATKFKQAGYHSGGFLSLQKQKWPVTNAAKSA